MRIKLIEHAKERAKQRGAINEEVKAVVLNGRQIKAKRGRKAKEMIFEYEKEWLRKTYPQKKVQVIYVEEENQIIVITVKVFYGKWR